MINSNDETTFASSLSVTDSKCFNLKELIDDIISDFEIAKNLSRHTGNICILRSLQRELGNIKDIIEDFQEDRLALIINKLIDDEGNEVIDDNLDTHQHYAPIHNPDIEINGHKSNKIVIDI
jgi:hypothetical protein